MNLAEPESGTEAKPVAAAAPAPPGNPLLTAPLLPTLVRFAIPNMVAMFASAAAAVAETSYVGQLGVPALAGMALVFPFVMLQGMLSNGAMGGGVSSAVSRALGAGQPERANALAVHAFWIAVSAGLLYMLLLLSLGPTLFRALGGRDEALAQASAYAGVAFVGSVGVWLLNTFSSVIRGSGNMMVPATTTFVVAITQVLVGGALGLGWGPFPRWGMPGVALGQVAAYALGSAFLYGFLRFGRLRIRLRIVGTRLQRDLLLDILRVGALACISPFQTVATMLILTWLVAKFGTTALAGYGIGIRLEFLLIPLSFAIGVASVPLVGMAIGVGNIARARRAAWTAAGLSASLLGVLGLLLAVAPDLWTHRFTDHEEVIAAAAIYFHWAGPLYGLLGLGMSLYFSSLGAGKAGGPVIAGGVRLLVIAVGGWFLVQAQAPTWSIYALASAAMAAYGLTMVWMVRRSHWGPAAASNPSQARKGD